MIKILKFTALFFAYFCLISPAAAPGAPLLAAPSGDDEFLSREEYQQHLWRNPRGIGCNHCHGERGEEVEFARYFSVHKDGRKSQHRVKIPSIQHISEERFKAALQGKSGVKNIMPNYHLTEREINNLYQFINQNKEQK